MPARPRVRITIAITARPSGTPELDARLLEKLLTRAVRAALAAEDVRAAEISLALLDDAGIAELNQRYLGRQGPTDVVAFPLYQPGEPPVGDVYLGFEQALRQATSLGVPPLEELARLAVHGTLHVLGYDHPAGGARERSAMWRVQERILREVMGRE
ncbi:MAG: rRNA maturation RNase YbeY [Gemmatimonadetes bacterium]|nr:rRNA maturation RNase YbeY [Gemmatimonadota bacterium]